MYIDVQGEIHSLDAHSDRISAGQALADFFSFNSDHEVFTPAHTSFLAQQEMLAAVDSNLLDTAATACEEAQPVTLQELTKALGNSPRGNRPSCDGLPYEFLQHFWQELGQLLLDGKRAASEVFIKLISAPGCKSDKGSLWGI